MTSMFSANRTGWAEALDRAVADYLPALHYVSDEPLARHTSFRIGGGARRMAFPRTTEELVILAGIAEECGVTPFLLGNGTNLLAADEGVDTLVIQTGEGLRAIALETDGVTVSAEAGVSLAALGVFAWKHGLAGLEFAHGIPGSLGGGVVMNAGAYGGELKDVLTEVTALFPDGVRTLRAEELALGYRRSLFTDHPEAVVLRAKLRLTRGDGEEIKARMDALAEKRRASQPLELPSAGSTFKRPEGNFAGTLIDRCGLKGTRVGGAEVSVKHAGFVVNVGGATCADVLALIEKIQETVFAHTGIRLEPEVRLLR